MLGLLLLLQTAPADPPQTIDLTPAAGAPECRETAGDGEIMVCGRRDDAERYRLRPLPPRYAESDEISLDLPGGGKVEPRVEMGRLYDPRIMVHFRIPF